MDKLFNVNMTSNEARLVFFTEVDGKTPKEIEELKAAYFKVLDVILQRELDEARQGWMC